jgi:hypothetical protein
VEEIAYYLTILYQFEQSHIVSNVNMRLHEANEKMSVERWLRAGDEVRNLIEVSQCLCRDLNLKHPEQEFEQTPYRLTAIPFTPCIILSDNNQPNAQRVNVNYIWKIKPPRSCKCVNIYCAVNVAIPPTCFGHSCGHPQGGALRRIDTYFPDDGQVSGRNMQ